MTDTDQTARALQRVIARFPDQASEIRHAALRDRNFRDMCDDLSIALETLARFESFDSAASRPEIPEYVALIREMEAEVRVYLSRLDNV